ncbi:MAG: response regulator [Desulfobacterales bacterium]|nr:response regulator [Desulfobacterales bacterium]
MKRKQTILVVDDEEMILAVFQRLLSKEQYTVLTASNGKKALEVVAEKSPDLVMLDLKLPDMSGIDVLRRIKRINENIEVIIITGYGTMKTARAAMRLGAYDYVTKPFDNNYITALIEDVLSPASANLLQKARGDKEVLKEASVLKKKLVKIGHCKGEKACLWEVAVKAFVLGQDKISIDWMEDQEIPNQEKLKLMELVQIITANMTKR